MRLFRWLQCAAGRHEPDPGRAKRTGLSHVPPVRRPCRHCGQRFWYWGPLGGLPTQGTAGRGTAGPGRPRHAGLRLGPRAYTLLELLVVVCLVSVVAGILATLAAMAEGH